MSFRCKIIKFLFLIIFLRTTNGLEFEGVRKFPDNFKFGAATAAYQIEGAWNASGKGPSIWDTLTHTHPELIVQNGNGDVADDSYHFYKDDVKLIKGLGMNYYRFSISWSRILPNGDISSLNQAGLTYYNKLIDELIANEIEPMVTMYHYDLPQSLQDLGGLVNPLMISYFRNYAEILFRTFGDRVKRWITFNEPSDFCIDGYGNGAIAPLVFAPGVGEYLCGQTVLLAHAEVYHLYQRKYAKKQKGKIGITLSSRFFYKKDNKTEDAVDRAMQFSLGWFAHPIYSLNGGYPPIMITQILRNSISEGRTWSRLPNLAGHLKEAVHGTADFLGLNYYSSRLVEMADPPLGNNPSLERDSRTKTSVEPNWKQAKSPWLYSVPQGLGDILRWIRDEYNNTEVVITENGWSDDGEIEDDDRIVYIKEHLKHVQKAVVDDKCNCVGYTVWSIIDNFEWMKGYSEKFGLYGVNMSSPMKERFPKKSAGVMRDIIKNSQILN